MGIRLFNSMHRAKEDFVPLKAGHIGIYVCGVTVYDYCHIGHARVYVVFDAVVRWLRREHQVTYVRNFTDVDDKIIRRAHESGEDPLKLAARFAVAFHEDMALLGVERADVEPRVSDHMQEIIDFVGDLEAKGHAYRVSSSTGVDGAGDDVYFRVRSFDAQRYLQLSGRQVEDLQAGARVAVDERKEDAADFALWKSAKPGEVAWPSPFGRGRPGWHIECSAMAKKHLGITFDIHCGGRDLIFPHHTNEIAQSEAANKATMARYWLHNGFVDVDGEKMSKSLGNFFTIRDVLKRFTPESVRMLILQTHYRGPIAFADSLVEDAERRVQRLYEAHDRIVKVLATTPLEAVESLAAVFGTPARPFAPWADFVDGMNDDFNTPKAIAALLEVVGTANVLVAGREKEVIGKKLKPGQRATLLKECQQLLNDMGAILGLGQKAAAPFLLEQRTLRLAVRGLTEAAVQAVLAERAEAKAAKDFVRADAARDRLFAMGIEVRDTATGVEWAVQAA